MMKRESSWDMIAVDANRLPRVIVGATVLVSVLPFVLHLLGVNFGNDPLHLDPSLVEGMTKHEFYDSMFDSFAGAFTHVLLEWSAVTIAIATAVLALIQYRITGNLITPIIGLALLSAGLMDAFHALAATKLLRSVADDVNFIPFTWALSRMFNVLVLSIGAGVFLFPIKHSLERVDRNKLVLSASVLSVLLSYGVIQICAVSSSLPATTFPDGWITRPYDVIPLVWYVVLGVWLLPKVHRMHESVFTHALMWSMLPAIATQLHMAFGSFQLFDAHFNVGHFLKAVSYLLPFIGMAIDYIATYRKEQSRLAELADAHQALTRQNKELEQFAYIASHDLQEPLRTLLSFSDLLQQDYKGTLDEQGESYLRYMSEASAHMSALVKGLMDYSRIGRHSVFEKVDCDQLVKQVVRGLEPSIREVEAKVTLGSLPTVRGLKQELHTLFHNLLSNAIKFRALDQAPEITIQAVEENGAWKFSVQDNGIGIDERYREKVFVIFQRLHTQKEYQGTGIGLSYCQKIVELHKGKIWVDSTPGKGSIFFFTIPNQDL